jgi:tetratricopeptide (TPR) repeat protein
MKKYFYLILLIFTGILFLCILLFSKEPKKPNTGLKNRTGSIALAGEWMDTKNAVKSLLQEIELNPSNFTAKLNLAQAYIQESRVTGDHGYYDSQALNLLNEVIENEPKNFDALCCKSAVLLSQHHFSDALQIAKKALPINPNNAFIYGLMCDAYVELGNYTEAVKMTDLMISIRPDIRSYSRISYLREIHGDLPGAIQASKFAVNSGLPGLEETAWARMILAHLYEDIGALDSAEYHYRTALIERPNYAYALAGLGRLEKSNKNYKNAIRLYEKAERSITEYSFSDDLTELYALNSQKRKSKENAKRVISILSPMGGNDESVAGHGHYADKELAYAYLKNNEYALAIKHALIEYKRRPKNIEVCELLAWTYYKNKQYVKANQYIDKALKTNCKSPELLCRSGLIKLKNKDFSAAKTLLNDALHNHPLLNDFELAVASKKALAIIN